LTLTGIATFLTPTPSDRPESTDPSDSYNFNGLQQTSREGIPVPVVYGEIFTGSVVLSVKVEEDDEELEADFDAGAGNPNPDPKPVPDPPTAICPDDYYGWRWDMTFASPVTLRSSVNNVVTEPLTTLSVKRQVQHIPFMQNWMPGYDVSSNDNHYWVTSNTRTVVATQSSLVWQLGAYNSGSYSTPTGAALNFFAIVYTTNLQVGHEYSFTGTFTLYPTATDYNNETNGVVWSGNTYPAPAITHSSGTYYTQACVPD